MSHSPTVLEIDLKNLSHNFRVFRSRISNNSGIMAVVKASGYGSDAIGVARHLEMEGVDYFAVAYADEGISLRQAGVQKPILVLHPQIQNLELLLNYDLEPNLYSFRILDAFLNCLRSKNMMGFPAHLKFNTGLNRLGFGKEDLDRIHDLVKNRKEIRIKSLFSHLAASEDMSVEDFTRAQLSEFEEISNRFKSLFGYLPLRHMSNSSGVLNYDESHFDLIRIGIGLYGFSNDPQNAYGLKNVLRLKTIISQIHKIDKGAFVGYNMGFEAERDMTSATIPIGHADGLPRALGKGKISLKVGGKRAPIIGNVCMDMTMIDISGIQCEEGDEVIIFEDRESILNMAEKSKTISYELLTALGPRIKRVLV